MTEIDKLIHVMLVLMIVGFVLASAVVMHRVSGNKAMALRSLSLSGWFDRWASVGCLVQLVTGGFLVWRRSYQWTTPWIVVAFVSVSLLAITLMAVGLQKKESRDSSGRYDKETAVVLGGAILSFGFGSCRGDT